jgi:hypothetical protein
MTSIESRVLIEVKNNGNMRDMKVLDKFRPS